MNFWIPSPFYPAVWHHTIRQIIFLVLLLCLAGSVFSTQVTAVPYPYGEPEFTATIIGDNECEPGNVTPLTIKIANIATNSELILDASNPVASSPIISYAVMLTLEPGNSPADIIHTVETLPVLPPSTGVPLIFPVIIPADAKAGTYTLDLKVQYQYADSISKEGTDTNVFHYTAKNTTLNIPIAIKEKVRIRVDNVTTTRIAPGQDGTIRADITNIGYYSGTNASAELTTNDPSPITPYQGSFHLGTFGIGETRAVEWRASVSDTIDATSIPATVLISYEDRHGNQTTSQPISIGIPVHTGPKFRITYDQPQITPGGSAPVHVRYSNIGDAPASNATAKIVPVNPVSSVQTGGLLGTIGPGESVVIEYLFSLSEKALVKPYGVLTDVKYRGNDGSVYLSDPLKIQLATVEPGILAILLSPVSLIILLGIFLIIGYLFLKREGKLV